VRGGRQHPRRRAELGDYGAAIRAGRQVLGEPVGVLGFEDPEHPAGRIRVDELSIRVLRRHGHLAFLAPIGVLRRPAPERFTARQGKLISLFRAIAVNRSGESDRISYI
jgi:hypothetical protein